MTVAATPHPWSADALMNKALLYIGVMEGHTTDDWEYGLWASLALELMARAALAHTSPVLLADASNWRNLSYALGNPATSKKFSPVSIGVGEVLGRLEEMHTTITSDITGFCRHFFQRRNSELHSGELAFHGRGSADWLPPFYIAVEALLGIMGRPLDVVLKNAEDAVEMIAAYKDDAAKAVLQDINAHRLVWQGKPQLVRDQEKAKAEAWATKETGHRCSCPACSSEALVQGKPSGTVSTKVEPRIGEVTEKQRMIPASFQCIACGLRISGLAKLTAAGLGDAYTSTSIYPASQYFELYDEDDLEEARREAERFEPDFNE